MTLHFAYRTTRRRRHPGSSLRSMSTFVVMVRPGHELDWASLPTQLRPLRRNLVEGPRIEISASEIRRRVAAGQSVRYLTPPAVEDHLLRNRLYR